MDSQIEKVEQAFVELRQRSFGPQMFVNWFLPGLFEIPGTKLVSPVLSCTKTGSLTLKLVYLRSVEKVLARMQEEETVF